MKKSLASVIAVLLLAALLVCTAGAAQLGDVDGNGKINSADARIALRAAARLQTLTYDEAVRADIDGNGKINSADARTILRIAAHLEDAPTTEEVTVPPAPTTEPPTTQPPAAEPTTQPQPDETTTKAPETPPAVTDAPIQPNPPAQGALTAKQVYNKAVQYTVEISVSGATEDYEFTATGSGFYISADGNVVTNYHVIEDAKTITVIDANGDTHDVSKILAYDKNMDVAIIRADGVTNATPAVLGKTAPETGDVIYTLGSSQGLTGTFTQGIVSNAARVDESFNPLMTYIQIDAPITDGNSGGPLINEYGEVVGINAWGYILGQNLNFSIPITYVDEMYLDRPLTMQEYTDADTTLRVSSDPNAPLFSGRLEASLAEAHVKPNGVASVLLLANSPFDTTAIMNCEVSIQNLPASVSAQTSEWAYSFRYGAAYTILTFTSPVDVPAAEIQIGLDADPSFNATFRLTVDNAGADVYFGTTDVPDFGVVSGVAPAAFRTDLEYIMFYGLVPLTRGSNPALIYKNVSDSAVKTYRGMLEDAGYTLYETNAVLSSEGNRGTSYEYKDTHGNYVTVHVERSLFSGNTVVIELSQFLALDA